MNISRGEQRVLHVLAQGGYIRHHRGDNGRIFHVDCFTRDGYRLADCTLDVFAKLRRKRLIESRSASPYRISQRGRHAVRSQADNR
ncbi:YjhX family toxin [Mesorhizobium sp. 1B3]|uniref:YjhX family toxin n=1 Tax=Mesorhizobium sp. 1B3 TaxID=3243599 RepID=UPI003D97BB29